MKSCHFFHQRLQYVCGDSQSLSHGIFKSAFWWQMDLLEILGDVSPLTWKTSSVPTEQLKKPFSSDWKSFSDERWNISKSPKQVQLPVNSTFGSNRGLLTTAVFHSKALTVLAVFWRFYCMRLYIEAFVPQDWHLPAWYQQIRTVTVGTLTVRPNQSSVLLF